MASENLPPQIISRVMTEIRELVKKPADGIEYYDPTEEDDDETKASSNTDIPSSSSSLGETTCAASVSNNVGISTTSRMVSTFRSSISEIYAKISGPEGTPFEGGKFLMKLVLSEDYPNTPPRGYFLTKIYHPNVAPNGDICVNTLKKDWAPDTTLKHILQVIRCLLIVPFPESSLNDEAGKLFMESYEEFARRARIMTDVHAERSGEMTGASKLAILGSANEVGDATTVFGTSNSGLSVTASSSSTAGSSSSVAKVAKKAKDAKTKGLKRL